MDWGKKCCSLAQLVFLSTGLRIRLRTPQHWCFSSPLHSQHPAIHHTFLILTVRQRLNLLIYNTAFFYHHSTRKDPSIYFNLLQENHLFSYAQKRVAFSSALPTPARGGHANSLLPWSSQITFHWIISESHSQPESSFTYSFMTVPQKNTLANISLDRCIPSCQVTTPQKRHYSSCRVKFDTCVLLSL